MTPNKQTWSHWQQWKICRHCGAKIRVVAGDLGWFDTEDYRVCQDGQRHDPITEESTP